MKKLLKGSLLFSVIFALSAVFVFTSCGSDDDDDKGGDAAKALAGVYSGTFTGGGSGVVTIKDLGDDNVSITFPANHSNKDVSKVNARWADKTTVQVASSTMVMYYTQEGKIRISSSSPLYVFDGVRE